MCVQQHGGLPAEYQEVEYIESTGTQYIDTMVNVTNTLSFECRWLATSNGIYGLNGAYYWTSQYGQKAYCFGRNTKDKIYMGIGTTSYTSRQSEKDVIYTTKGDMNHMETKSNTDIYQMTGEFREPSLNFYIFATDKYTGEADVPFYFAKERIYSFNLYENNIIKRYFIPCKTTKSVIDVSGKQCPIGTKGLYDKVEGKFYTNQGTGEFLYG